MPKGHSRRKWTGRANRRLQKILQHGQADVLDALDKAERPAAIFKGNRLEDEAIPVFALDFKADAADDLYAEGRQAGNNPVGVEKIEDEPATRIKRLGGSGNDARIFVVVGKVAKAGEHVEGAAVAAMGKGQPHVVDVKPQSFISIALGDGNTVRGDVEGVHFEAVFVEAGGVAAASAADVKHAVAGAQLQMSYEVGNEETGFGFVPVVVEQGVVWASEPVFTGQGSGGWGGRFRLRHRWKS